MFVMLLVYKTCLKILCSKVNFTKMSVKIFFANHGRLVLIAFIFRNISYFFISLENSVENINTKIILVIVCKI